MANYPESATDRRVQRSDLLAAVAAIFRATEMDAADATLLAESLVHADMRGVHSHGVLRVPDYVAKLTTGGVNPQGRPREVSRKGGAIVVDGDNSMGQIGGRFAIDLAISAAQETGLAFVALRGTNHCGALDWYTLRAAGANMIGVVGSNALPTMAPIGGIDKIVGMNPISFAAPRREGAPFVLDLALGATAHGKIRVYHQKGLPIPEGWAFDAAGNPTTNAALALEGLIQPSGQHKGIALAMMVGILSTMLSGASYGTRLGNMVDGAQPGKDGQFFLAIDIAAFRAVSDFESDLGLAIEQIHSSRAKTDNDKLLAPGDMEAQFERDYRDKGILLPGATVEDIVRVANELKISTSEITKLSRR